MATPGTNEQATASREAPRRFATQRRRVLSSAALVTAVVVGLVAWDASRQSQAAIGRLARRHRLLAFALANDLSSRLASNASNASGTARDVGGLPGERREALFDEALADVRALEREGEVTVLLRAPWTAGFRTTDRRVLASPPLEAALRDGLHELVLGRDEADRLGLPRRQAVAGLASIRHGGTEPEAVALAVVSSARAERDRVTREEWRIGVSLALVLVILGGASAVVLREQRRELETAARLDRERGEREREVLLGRADRMATLAALSLGIAHELATPLGVITGRVEQLEPMVSGSDRARKALRTIEEQVVRMSAVMKGFLALARGGAPELAHVDASVVVRDARDLVRHRFAKAGVRLETLVEADGRVACDAPLFTQVLVNLLVNACEHSPPEGSVRLSLTRDADGAVFEVEDEGAGIPEVAAARATEPFFTTRSTEGGTGLGLAIAREIVSHHGGTIALANRASGAGARAVVRLPLVSEHAA